MSIKWVLSFVFAGALVACTGGGGGSSGGSSGGSNSSSSSGMQSGGSSSSSSSSGSNGLLSEAQLMDKLEPVDSWIMLLNQPASQLTEAELQQAYWGQALDYYTGELELAEITPESIEAFTALSYYSPYFLPVAEILAASGVEAFDRDKYDTTTQTEVSLDANYDCTWRSIDPPVIEEGNGSIHIVGDLSSGEGLLDMSVENCHPVFYTMSGEVQALVRPFVFNPDPEFPDVVAIYNAGSVFYNDMALEQTDTGGVTGATSFRGFDSYSLIPDSSESESRTVSFVSAFTFDAPDAEQYLYYKNRIRENISTDYLEQGVFAIGSLGSMTYQKNYLPYPDDAVLTDDPIRQKMVFKGVNGTSFTQSSRSSGYVLLTVDSDGDGEDDLARYYADGSFDNKDYYDELRPVADLTHPPVMWGNELTRVWEAVGSLEVELGGLYTDLDTPTEDLEVTFEWRVSGNIVESVNGPVLSSDYYSGDDYEIVVWAVISDGIHTVRSQPYIF